MSVKFRTIKVDKEGALSWVVHLVEMKTTQFAVVYNGESWEISTYDKGKEKESA